MKSLWVFLIFFLFMGSLGGAEVIQLKPATPKVDPQATYVQPDLMPYIEFILEWTSYKYKGENLPKIKIEDHDLVQVFAYGDLEYANAESQGKKLNTVLAVYDAQRKTIFISDSIKDNKRKMELALVHELVHFLQDINGYTESLGDHLQCTESEAYDVQMLWMILVHKIDAKDKEIGTVHELSLLSAIRCMGNKSQTFSKPVKE